MLFTDLDRMFYLKYPTRKNRSPLPATPAPVGARPCPAESAAGPPRRLSIAPVLLSPAPGLPLRPILTLKLVFNCFANSGPEFSPRPVATLVLFVSLLLATPPTRLIPGDVAKPSLGGVVRAGGTGGQ